MSCDEAEGAAARFLEIELEQLAHTAHSLGALLGAVTPSARSPSCVMVMHRAERSVSHLACEHSPRSRVPRVVPPHVSPYADCAWPVRLPVICQLSGSTRALLLSILDNKCDTISR
jgi:hypothetical protein